MVNNALRAVLFDMDGVIFDTERLAGICWREVAPNYGIDDVEPALIECTGISREASRAVFARRFAGKVCYDAFHDDVARAIEARYPDGAVPMMPGVRKILTALRTRGVPAALASSTDRPVVLRQLCANGIDAYFDAIVCGDMVSRSKPAPDIFLKAAAMLNVPPEACCVVEDSHNGIRAARAAGMHPVMIPDQMPVTDEMRALAEAILPSLGAFEAWLLGATDEKPSRKPEEA